MCYGYIMDDDIMEWSGCEHFNQSNTARPSIESLSAEGENSGA